MTPEWQDGHAADVQALIAQQPESLGVLQRVCRAAATPLSASGVGISLMTGDGTRGVASASDRISERIEELQFTLGEGPCIEAFSERRPVLSEDLSDNARQKWPMYAAAAYDQGVRAVFAFPLQIGVARLGVMDVLRDRVGPLDDQEIRTALLFADVAVTALLDGQAAGGQGLDDGLDSGVGRRAHLFQAQGMVMVQLGVSIEEAMARMRAYAYAESRSLDEIARAVIERRLRFDPDRQNGPDKA